MVSKKSNELLKDSAFKKQVYDSVKYAFDDSDIHEAVYDALNKEFGKDKDMATTYKNYNDSQDKYWNTIEEVAKNVTNKIGDNLIINDAKTPFVAQGEMAVNKVVRDTVNSSWNSYVFRHFEDYWVSEQIPNFYDDYTKEDYDKYKNN